MKAGDCVKVVCLIYPGPKECIGKTGTIIGPMGNKTCDVSMDDTKETHYFDYDQELELIKENEDAKSI